MGETMSKAAPARTTIAAELARLAQSTGYLTPQAVVRAAMNPKSKLHASFDWDDTSAARKYRIWQARQLIASVEFEPIAERAPMRAYVNIIEEGEEAGRYMRTLDAMADPASRKILLARVLRDLNALADRYEGLEELAKVWRAVRKAA